MHRLMRTSRRTSAGEIEVFDADNFDLYGTVFDKLPRETGSASPTATAGPLTHGCPSHPRCSGLREPPYGFSPRDTRRCSTTSLAPTRVASPSQWPSCFVRLSPPSWRTDPPQPPQKHAFLLGDKGTNSETRPKPRPKESGTPSTRSVPEILGVITALAVSADIRSTPKAEPLQARPNALDSVGRGQLDGALRDVRCRSARDCSSVVGIAQSPAPRSACALTGDLALGPRPRPPALLH